MHPVAVVLGKHLGKRGFQLLGRLLGADRLLATRVGVDPGENVGQRNVLTLAFAEAFMRRPSSSDSTITPRTDCATNL